MSVNAWKDSDLIQQAILGQQYDSKVVLPGIVQAYNPAAQTVDVQPVGGTYFAGRPQAWPMIPDVPLACMQFGGGSVSVPLAAGDPVTLLFSSRPLDAWRQAGIDADPQSPRFSHMSDAIALPFGVSQVGKAPAGSAKNWTLVQGAGGLVLLGAGASLGAARVTDTVAPSAELSAWMVAVVNACAANTPPIAIPPFTAASAGVISSGSAVVKIG